MKVNRLLVAGVLALLFVGCGGTKPLPGGASNGGSPVFPSSGDFDSGVQTSGNDTGRGPGFRSFPNATQAQLDLLNDSLVVYFEFDSSEIRADFNDMLAAHGSYLASNPNVSVRLEGHADERGSREYNIGLGERRAQAVRRILLLQGAAADQLSTVSYGEERPAVIGSDEEAYRLNRRVELVYR